MKQPITREQAEKLQQQNVSIKLVDIRSAAEFEKMHVPRAVNIPAETLENSLPQFATSDTIVCVCNKGHERSQSAAEFLYNCGFENTFYLEGGTLGWLAE
jgi:rhodanese-related sulfurtransferase